MTDQTQTPALPIWDVPDTPGETSERLEQLTEQVSGKSFNGESPVDRQPRVNGQTPFSTDSAPQTNSDEDVDHPLIDGGMPPSSGTVADSDPPETNDWRGRILSGRRNRPHGRNRPQMAPRIPRSQAAPHRVDGVSGLASDAVRGPQDGGAHHPIQRQRKNDGLSAVVRRGRSVAIRGRQAPESQESVDVQRP